jgi:UrcA family protein
LAKVIPYIVPIGGTQPPRNVQEGTKTMSNFISKLTTAGYLVLASVPVAGLTASIAHASPAPATVRIGDLDLGSKSGLSTFNHRVMVASHKVCRDERSLSARETCEGAVRAEANDKLAAVIAHSGAATTLAAR